MPKLVVQWFLLSSRMGDSWEGGLCAVAVTGKSHEGKGLMFMDLYPTCAFAALGDEMRLDSKINKL